MREVIALCVGEGLDYEAAAKALGIPGGTVASRLSRARKELRSLADAEPARPTGPGTAGLDTGTARLTTRRAPDPQEIRKGGADGKPGWPADRYQVTASTPPGPHRKETDEREHTPAHGRQRCPGTTQPPVVTSRAVTARATGRPEPNSRFRIPFQRSTFFVFPQVRGRFGVPAIPDAR
ncbi:RNA polymerase sigma factor [Streptomyces flaveolus]|uniref:RNA polymerase sigma factor n=1 Tax=Streptomyces flaveolus TaxID=67297 RepID=UPI003F53FBC5